MVDAGHLQVSLTIIWALHCHCAFPLRGSHLLEKHR